MVDILERVRTSFGMARATTHRAGSVEEAGHFLTTLDQLYLHLEYFYYAPVADYELEIFRRFPKFLYVPTYDQPRFEQAQGGHYFCEYNEKNITYLTRAVVEDELQIERVAVNSPGVWEFLGKLNPLMVLTQYLSERHERKKDIGYRNSSESEKLKLENEILRQSLEKAKTDVLNDRIRMLKSLGIEDLEIQKLIFGRATTLMKDISAHHDNDFVESLEIIEIEKE